MSTRSPLGAIDRSPDVPFGSESLPLICPRCFRLRARELLLDVTGTCPCCGVRYQTCDDIPIMLADDGARDSLSSAVDPSDPRAHCYQHYDDYGLGLAKPGRQPPHVAFAEKVDYAMANTAANGRVLEVGSGRGRFAGFGGEDYCALDFSLSFLRDHLGGFSRVCASAETIPLASGSCRLVFSFATLEHVPRPDLAFAEVDRVLAVGGIACLHPAWHCRDWAADGLDVRPYRDLTRKQKIAKALIPLRDSVIYRAGEQIPWRMWRRLLTRLSRAPSWLRYRSLNANYEQFWGTDADACSSIDSHEGILFFDSRNYEILEPRGGSRAKLLFRAGPIIARKTLASATY